MKTILRTITLAFCLALLLPFGARAYYSPKEGQWISRDPVQETADPNLYMFARNRPLNSVDHLGLCTASLGSSPLQPRQCKCSSTLQFTYSRPQVVHNWDVIATICGGRAACAIPDYTVATKCEECGCGGYKIVAKIEGTCEVYYADASSVAVEYFPHLEAVLKHENCHCDDYYAAFLNMLRLYDEVEYPNKERCEAVRAVYDRNTRERLMQRITPSVNHTYGKFKKGGECFAEFGFK